MVKRKELFFSFHILWREKAKKTQVRSQVRKQKVKKKCVEISPAAWILRNCLSETHLRNKVGYPFSSPRKLFFLGYANADGFGCGCGALGLSINQVICLPYIS